MRLFKRLNTGPERCSPAFSSLQRVLERDDARRARVPLPGKITLISRTGKEVGKKPVQSSGAAENGYSDEQDELLAPGPEIFEDEDRVQDAIEVDESVKSGATAFDDDLEGWMRIGPEGV